MTKENSKSNVKSNVNIEKLVAGARKHGKGGGGGRSSELVGLWCDKNGKQRHIKTASVGVGVDDKFILAVEDDKIVFYVLSDKQVQQLQAQGVHTLQTARRNNAKNTVQAYASIEGISDELYKELVRINGGKNVRHHKNDTDSKGVKWGEKYVVKRA